MKREERPGKAPAAAGRAVAGALRRDRPLRRFLLALSKAASEAGGAAFLAGGFLRDIVDGKPGADVDVMVAGMSHREIGAALNALPCARLGIRKVVPAGKHFPVYRVAAGWSGRYVDVSAARGRGEERGLAACAVADAARRDFTINSLLYELRPGGNRLAGELLDPFGGVRDLAGRVIRCVGSAGDRLREDPVRALRAIRMKNERKRYRIDPETFRSIRRLGPSLLPGVPADRFAGELLRSLQANPRGTIEDLRRAGILRALLPELSRKRSGIDRAARRYVAVVRASPGPIPPAILLANLLLDLSPRDAEAAARRLRFPNVRRVVATATEVRSLRFPATMRFPLAETEAILSRQEAPGPIIALYRAAAACDGARAKDLKRFLDYCRKKAFFIDGFDLRRAGISEGPEREETLLAVREATLAGRIGSREAALEMVRGPGSRPRAGAGCSTPCSFPRPRRRNRTG
jgi:tRNA nucleotidyltransferase/poly(A) polymerase